MSYSNTLYIGLGGTGVKSILNAKAAFLDNPKNNGKMPENVQFLGLDTDVTARNENVSSLHSGLVSLSANEFVQLQFQDPSQLPPHYTDWMPESIKSPGAQGILNFAHNGAKQIRILGFFGFQSSYNTIKNQISTKIASILQFVVANPNAQGMVNISIVGSIAGGTGSGTFLGVLSLVQEIIGANPSMVNLYIVTPDVFTALGTGPQFNNVNKNAYAALMELDLLFHDPATYGNVELNVSQTAKFKFKTKEPDNVFVLTNRIGPHTVNQPKLIYGLLGKILYASAGQIQNAANSVWSNLSALKGGGAFDISGKKGYASGIGLCEIIFDNQYLGRIYQSRLSKIIIKKLLEVQDSVVNKREEEFVSLTEIQEDNNYDQVLNSLLSSPSPSYPFPARKEDIPTLTSKIDLHVNQQESDALRSIESAKRNKLNINLEQLSDFVKNQVYKIDGPGNTLSFLSRIEDRINESFLAEIKEERERILKDLEMINHNITDNVNSLSAKRGLNLMGNTAKSLASISEAVNTKITFTLEILRREGAISFYQELLHEIGKLKHLVDTHIRNLKEAEIVFIDELKHLTNVSKSEFSEFSKLLHFDYINHHDINPNDDSVRFEHFLSSINHINLLNDSATNIATQLKNHTKPQVEKSSLFQSGVKDLLAKYSEKEMEELLHDITIRSTPTWNTDAIIRHAMGFEFNTSYLIGMSSENSLFSLSKFDNVFKNYLGSNYKDSAVNTNDNSRIVFFRIASMAPVFVISRTEDWKAEYDARMMQVASNAQITPHTMAPWERKVVNTFYDIYPANGSVESPLKIWVLGFIHGLIKFNDGEFRMRSEKQGKPINGFMISLGTERIKANEKFNSEHLFRELQLELGAKYQVNPKETELQLASNKTHKDYLKLIGNSFSEDLKSAIESGKTELLKTTSDMNTFNLINDEINILYQNQIIS